MTRWEYAAELISREGMEPDLNKMGRDGWEAFAVLQQDHGVIVLMKRPIVEAQGGGMSDDYIDALTTIARRKP